MSVIKKIALVGCTGSIGRQTLAVVGRHPEKFAVCCLVAHSSAAELTAAANRFMPAYAALTSGGTATGLNPGIKFLSGSIIAAPATFIYLRFAGLEYSLLALRMGARLALANKETLVCGGDIVMPLGGEIVPIDSEHSAIWQCLGFRRDAKFKNIIITASGGPFRDKKFEELEGVTPEQALAHPTWRMGAKITIDSATLLNKGYEVIEAHHLYGAGYGAIKTVIQPQSIVHSMVEFEDGAVLAQLSEPTMELPIQLALTYPERYDCALRPLDWSRALSLEFLPLVRKNYPLYDLALTCGEAGGVLPAALNAASEEAVHAFLNKQITFCDIFRVVDTVVGRTVNERATSFEQLAGVDAACRHIAQSVIKKR